MDKLPVYEMIIDENPESDVEVSFVALVDKPAIEKNFLAFNSQQLHFKTDSQKQIISGPAMVADTLIYRRDVGGEYNVFFSKETISQIAQKFFKKDYHKNLNLFHDPALSLQGVTIFESFVSDKARGIAPMKGFEDLPDGTWFISAKIDNPDVWAKIQSGEVKGFSVEGIFSYKKKPKSSAQEMIEQLSGTVAEFSHFPQIAVMANKIKDFLSNLKSELFDGTPVVNPAPAPTQQTLTTDYQLKDGTAVQIDKLEVGGIALVNGVPAPAGEHELGDGTKITVGEGGVITLVTPAMMQAPALQMSDVEAAIQKALGEYTAKMNEQAQKLADANKVIAEQSAQLEKQTRQINGLFEAIEKLADVPQADPVGASQMSFSQEKNQSKTQKREALIAFLHERKKAK